MQTGTHQTEQAAAANTIELELGDGSRLVLDDASSSTSQRRIENSDSRISLDDAMRMAGQPFAGYRRLRS